MAEKTLSPTDVRKELSKAIRQRLTEFGAEIAELQKREVKAELKKGGLYKKDTCPLCKKEDKPGVCTCGSGDLKVEPACKSELVKAAGAAEMAKPVGVAGRQPVGKSGTKPLPMELAATIRQLPGDKKGAAISAAQKPGVGGAPNPEVQRIISGAPHPDTTASLNDVKALRPDAPKPSPQLAATQPHVPGKATPNQSGNVEWLKDQLATIRANRLAASVKTPMAQAREDAVNLVADKKAAGVGFLNNLITRFRGVGTQGWKKTGSQGANRLAASAAALARSESSETNDLIKSLGDCALCGKSEHTGACN